MEVEWKTLHCVNKIKKGNLVSNFKSITCLPSIWKLLTGILAEELYEHLEKTNLLPWEKMNAEKEAKAQKINYLLTSG